jgi:23S rRNA pseudouridine1911/1915/1917 synthase
LQLLLSCKEANLSAMQESLMGNFSQDMEGTFIKHEIKVDPGQSAVRIDKYLVDKIEFVTRTQVQRGIDQGMVQVNGETVKSNYKVRPNDLILVRALEEHKPVELIPQDIPLDIVFEDDQILVVNKPAGLTVHPGIANYDGTLSNALAFYLGNKALKGDRYPYLVHRIDKDTSGLILVAKNDDALRFLAEQFKDHTTQRTYHALVWGIPDEAEGTIEAPIGRDIKDRKRFAVVGDDENGKMAITHYKVLEKFVYTSLVELKLETGRTHQIRVHMKHLGHPLFSDARYDGDRIRKGVVYSKYRQFVDNCFKIMPRQALHAKTLGFVHPTTKEEVHFDSELPADFSAVLEKWRNLSENNNWV